MVISLRTLSWQTKKINTPVIYLIEIINNYLTMENPYPVSLNLNGVTTSHPWFFLGSETRDPNL